MIHPSAIVDPRARLAADVEIDAYSVIGPDVQLGEGTKVGAHALVSGCTTLGAHNRVGPHAVIGAPAQVRDTEGQGGRLEIGSGNQLREFCTIHCGTAGSITRLGDDNMLMAYSHVAHDCLVGSRIELANVVQLGGHVVVEDGAVVGGLAAVHQFVRLGRHCMVAAGSMVAQDVLPFCMVAGDRARVYGLNVIGLRRAGFPAEVRRLLKRALRLMLSATTLDQGLDQVRRTWELQQEASVEQLISFAQSARRGTCRPISVARDR